MHLTGGMNLSKVSLALANGVLVSYETEGQYSGRGSNARLHGLDPTTGVVRWTTELPLQNNYDGAPLLWGGRIFVHSHDARAGGVAWGPEPHDRQDRLAHGRHGRLRELWADRRRFVRLLRRRGQPGPRPQPGHRGTGLPLRLRYHDGGNSSIVHAKGRLYLNDFQGSQNNPSGRREGGQCRDRERGQRHAAHHSATSRGCCEQRHHHAVEEPDRRQEPRRSDSVLGVPDYSPAVPLAHRGQRTRDHRRQQRTTARPPRIHRRPCCGPTPERSRRPPQISCRAQSRPWWSSAPAEWP